MLPYGNKSMRLVQMNKRVASFVLNNFTNDTRVLKEAITLQTNGYNLTVVALHETGLHEHEQPFGINIHRVKLKSRSWGNSKFLKLLKYFEFIYRAVKNYRMSDILHCNDLHTLPIGVIIKLFFNKNAKIIYDAHEFEINDQPYQSALSIKLHYWFERTFIRYANNVITVSDSIAQEYQRLYQIPKPILVLNAPPFQQIEKKNIFRETFNIQKDQTIFLYQGGISKGRGIEVLLQTFQTLTDPNYVIVFMGNGPLAKYIQEAAQHSSNIFYHPAVSPKILLDYTSSADYGILFYENSCLNHYYCSPNKMFEYIMAGLPVIVSNLYEMAKIVSTYQIGVIARENSPEGLMEAMDAVAKLKLDTLQANTKFLQTIYNWEHQEKILLEAYHAL